MRAAWVMFWFVGLIWGSSFLLIRIGVEVVNPVHLVFIRLSIAAVGLCIVVTLQRRPLPRRWRTWGLLALIGIGNNAVPFLLISYAEQSIDSGLASVLQAMAALFGLAFAAMAFADERINMQKVVGILLGFVGVIALAARNWQDGGVNVDGVVGLVAMVCASLSYGFFTTLSRKVLQDDIRPIVVAAITLSSGAVFTGILYGVLSLAGTIPATLPADLGLQPALAVLGLGFVNTFLAYLVFYEVVRTLGVGRATMVTYVVPIVGLLLGVVFLNEILDGYIILGAMLIFAGIGVVNLRLFRRLNRRERHNTISVAAAD